LLSSKACFANDHLMNAPPPIVALLTDFGEQDEYVGVLKGVILSRAPQAVVVDICHRIAPQDIRQAAAMINAAFAFFPAHTLYLMVVDPGVGGERRIVLAQAGQRRFLCPDNGLLSGLIHRGLLDSVRQVANQALFLKRVGSTFHGRDIMAPVAGYLAAGGQPAMLGPELAINALLRLEEPAAHREANGRLWGRVVSVDRFGNLITDIDRKLLTSLCEGDLNYILIIEAGSQWRLPLVASYGAVPPGQLLATIGSRETLEIAINMGNAAQALGLTPGTALQVRRQTAADAPGSIPER
jgi:S-adenosylmethionine hydrolase